MFEISMSYLHHYIILIHLASCATVLALHKLSDVSGNFSRLVVINLSLDWLLHLSMIVLLDRHIDCTSTWVHR